jgi:hypothetical protein
MSSVPADRLPQLYEVVRGQTPFIEISYREFYSAVYGEIFTHRRSKKMTASPSTRPSSSSSPSA